MLDRMATHPDANPADLAAARDEVAAWLAVEPDAPTTAEATDERLIEAFLNRSEAAGFSFSVGMIGENGSPRFELLWQHRGAEFVGFRQPPAAATPGEARLLGCAALLRNEWCRGQLDRARPLSSADHESLPA